MTDRGVIQRTEVQSESSRYAVYDEAAPEGATLLQRLTTRYVNLVHAHASTHTCMHARAHTHTHTKELLAIYKILVVKCIIFIS